MPTQIVVHVLGCNTTETPCNPSANPLMVRVDVLDVVELIDDVLLLSGVDLVVLKAFHLRKVGVVLGRIRTQYRTITDFGADGLVDLFGCNPTSSGVGANHVSASVHGDNHADLFTTDTPKLRDTTPLAGLAS